MDKMTNFRFETIPTVLRVVIVLVGIINCGCSASVPNKDDLFTINITMINFETTQEDEYAFVQYELPNEELWVVGYSPLVSMNSAHHILTSACASPASNKTFWTGGISCHGLQTIMHEWARNATGLTLPEDVGFAVGRNTPYKYIVVNIHYLLVLKNDYSGNKLTMSRTPRKYHASVLLTGTSVIYLKPKTHTVRTPFSCYYKGPPISIFAAHVHTHQWGRVNSLYRVRNGEICQIIKGDPQWPQSFYPLSSPVQIQNGDYVVGQCVYDNNDDRVIKLGNAHTDEMCNVYAMYSYEPARTSTGELISDPAPFISCWDNQFSEIASLIPPDSEVPPLEPVDIGGTSDGHHTHAEYTMDSFMGNLYTNIESWPDIESLPVELGEIGGIALTNADNELVIFHRGSRIWELKYFNEYRFHNEIYGPIEEDVLIHVDTRTGQTKYRWGAKIFFMPHGLTIDHQGNFWLTDVAMHQVFMFKQNDLTHPALTVGQMFQPGSGSTQFCQPADVAVMKNGDFFVADGYCNSRIIKFNSKGEYIMEWGSTMTGRIDRQGFPLPNEWNIIHSIALNEDAQLLCGADRDNFRIQCFHSNTGEFQRQIRVDKKETVGAIYAIDFVPNDNKTILFAVTGETQTSNKKVYIIDARSGNILTSFDSNPHLIAPHDIAVSTNAQEIYIGEVASSPTNALRKFQLSKHKDLQTQKLSVQISFKDKNFRVILIIMAAFAIPVLTAVIIGSIIRIRNMRKHHRFNTFLSDMNNGGTNRASILGDRMNRRKGFEKLEQYSDGENEPLDSNVADETITITSKQQAASPNNKSNTDTQNGQKLLKT